MTFILRYLNLIYKFYDWKYTLKKYDTLKRQITLTWISFTVSIILKDRLTSVSHDKC